MIACSRVVFVHGLWSGAIVQLTFRICARKLALVRHGHWMGHYPNGIERSEARRRLGIPEAAYLFLFVGICKEYKGLDSLVRSFAAIAPGAQLLIAGEFQSETYRATIDEQVARTSSVRLLPGHIAADDMQVLLNAADCVVLPYREVLTSGAAMLAMSFGRPVLAPDLGGMRDYMDEGSGVLYDVSDPSGLEQAMNHVRLRSFDSRVIRRHVEPFSWHDSARTILARIAR